jgi:hypothetical protein
MKKKVRKTIKSELQPDIKKSTANLFVNTIIFLLFAIIIVMSWSIYEKFNRNDETSIVPDNSEKPAEIIQVEVLNGCGVSGVADRFTDFLRAEKFDVVKTDNYVSFDINETMVIDRIGNLANAKAIAEALGIKQGAAFRQLNSDYFVDVTVIIGKDYHTLNPLN